MGECWNVELHVINAPASLTSQSKVREANQCGFVIRNLQLKMCIVTVRVGAVEPRHSHQADCVRQSKHMQVAHSLRKKMERYGWGKAVGVKTPDAEEESGGGGEGHTSVSQQ